MLHRSMTLCTTVVLLAYAPGMANAEPFPAEELRSIGAEHVPLINKIIVQTQLAGVYDDAGDQREASRCMEEAIADVERIPAGRVREWLRNKTTNKLGHSYAAQGGASLQQFNRAVKMLPLIQDVPLASQAYAKLGEKKFNAGKDPAGAELIATALTLANKCEDPATLAACLACVGKEQANIGNLKGAVQTLQAAFEIAGKCQSPADVLAIRCEVAGNYMNAKENEKALALLNELRKSISELGNAQELALFDRERPSLLLHLASLYLDLGDRDAALSITGSVHANLKATPVAPIAKPRLYEHDHRLVDSVRQQKLLLEIVGMHAALGNFQRAEEIALEIPDPRYQVMGLCKLIGARGPKESKEKIEQAFQQVTVLAATIDEPLLRAEAAMNIAKTHVKLKSPPAAIVPLLVVVEDRTKSLWKPAMGQP